MTIPTITVLPTAPARTDAPAVFNTRADAFLGALYSPFATEMNASINATNTDIGTIAGNVTLSQTARTAAELAETNAEAAETNAVAQVVLATNQVALATTQAGNSATSAASAASVYDQFDDRYLGAFSSDPTTDNDGGALVAGTQYFNTASNVTRVYNGSAFQDSASLATSVTVSQISDLTATAVELNYCDGVTSAIQTQLDSKDSLPSQTGNAGKVLNTNGTIASWELPASGVDVATLMKFGAM